MGEFFSDGGKLGKAKGYESRPGQAKMAERVAEIIEDRKHLVVEAGTGTGKSLAYLVPAAYAAQELGKKAIISTYTIHLQEQLFGKDVPIVQSLVPFEFTAALLKGRQNYLCPHRLKKAQQHQGGSFCNRSGGAVEGVSGVGTEDEGWNTFRYRFSGGCSGLGAGVQRGVCLHSKALWGANRMFLSDG